MALRKVIPSGDAPSTSMRALSFTNKMQEEAQLAHSETSSKVEPEVDIDLREVYFLIMHFLSTGPCQRTYGQFWNELLEHQLLPRRYHAWYSRSGVPIGDENDDGLSFPLDYNKLVERFPHVQTDHLVRLLKQLILSAAGAPRGISDGNAPNAANVPTLLGTGFFSLLNQDKTNAKNNVRHPPVYMRWPHMHVDQVRGLSLREIGGGFPRHHRAPTTRAACYAIAKPSTMVQKMQNIKRLRGHRNSVYCAIFDLSGRYVITGSDDRLVKIWSMETAYCLASCRGHEGDITDLAVSPNNALVASSSNDCIIRVWRLPDGMPVSVLRGHAGAVTAIAFSPRSPYHLLSSSDDGTCRIWDARNSQISPKIYIQRPSEAVAGRNGAPSSNAAQQRHQIFCCAFNANGTVFVTGSSDNLARVWNACKAGNDDSDQPNHEIDVLSGHENDVNYVQFSGCAVASKFHTAESLKDENFPKFKNSWFTHDNIVTCSRDGSAIIWIPRSRRSHGKVGRWTRAYHLKVPPPSIPPQPPRGPRQRILPTPRGVNMIIWSLDNRFVLAAIMDCRICVWNAADGSLVHSLKGHTDSTYVLDVHPFNPRVAMSAGYDGKTVVWDIWEGKPIKTYEISRFKLVDGKFSPDGTSIILSDDVGQLYILNTGQGESQNDAKYDQFFLGDYRPLIQDTHGNFLDQETQLPPYRRNMMDLLCDSSMVPYPEPYQSKYQHQRLGALNREWQPSSLKLAVGTDITLDQHYELLPLPDLDILVDPFPEFIDAMDWEPEIEGLSDDADSEYNVTEDNSSGKEQCSLSFDSSAEPGSSENDSDTENTPKDGLRRSRRKKIKADGEITTSSGRRVKRRNLDEYDDSSKSNRIRKSGSRKVPRRESSTSKSLRPQRAAARSALSMFSRLKGSSAGREGVSTDGEDEDGMGDESSGSESTIPDSDTVSDGSDNSLRMQKHLNSKGKEIAVVDSEILMKPQEFSESYTTARSTKKLVFKLPIRDVNGWISSENLSVKNSQSDLLGPSKVSEEISSSNRKHLNIQDSHFPSVHENGDGFLNGESEQPEKVDNLSSKDGIIKWGGVKARSSNKRPRLGDPIPWVTGAEPSANADNHSPIDNFENEGYNEADNGFVDVSPHSRTLGEASVAKESHRMFANAEGLDGTADYESFNLIECMGSMGAVELDRAVADDTTTSYNQYTNGVETHPELSNPEQSTRLRIRSKGIKIKSFRDPSYDECDGPLDSSSCMDHSLTSAENERNGIIDMNSEVGYKGLRPDQRNENSDSHVQDTSQLGLHSNSKSYTVVYRRSRSQKGRPASEPNGCSREPSASGASNADQTTRPEFLDFPIEGPRRTRSMGLKLNSNSLNKAEHNLSDERRSSSRMAIGLRSARNKRGSYSVGGRSLIDKRSHQSDRKRSWLMLSMHDGLRYIPQLGDEVIYLRQGHQEYMEECKLGGEEPWTSTEGKVRAVELCKVEELEYATFAGSGESCCKLVIKFIDPTSSVHGESFNLTLPEVTGFPDFLVERTRFDAAIQNNWTRRDKCQVWWKNEDEEDGSWWEGRIVGVEPKSLEFPDSPWERYVIQYKSDSGTTHRHSPWELYASDTKCEQPHIDDESREKLLAALAKLEQSGNRTKDLYGLQILQQTSEKSYFCNRFPVPLSLDVIHSRLENNYYRSLEAFKHDVEVMLSNAEAYFERNAEVSPKMRRLSDWFTRTLSSL